MAAMAATRRSSAARLRPLIMACAACRRCSAVVMGFFTRRMPGASSSISAGSAAKASRTIAIARSSLVLGEAIDLLGVDHALGEVIEDRHHLLVLERAGDRHQLLPIG